MKKLNKFFAILVSLAMMATLCVSFAFAANPKATSLDANDPVKTKITKAYNKANGVGAPTVQTFNFTAVNTTVDDNDEALTGYKSHADVTATVNGATSLSVTDIFAGTDIFTEAGKYRFIVTEDAPKAADGYTGTNDTINGRVATKEVVSDDTNFTTTETVTYSQAKYRVDLVVASNTDATGNTTYYVQSAAVTQLLDDDGTDADGTLPAKPTGDATTDGDGINLTYKNKVNKEIVRDPDDSEPTTKDEDKQALEISKTTALADGVAADTEIPDQEFNFKATVTFPANTKATSYTTVIKQLGENDAVEIVKAGPTFTSSALTQTFTLKAGQWLAFTDIEAGATVTVTEDTYPGFEASGLEANYVVKDTGANAIDVTNKWDPSSGTVTGILMSNIPYIVLALVAIGGLVAYVVVRRKNGEEA